MSNIINAINCSFGVSYSKPGKEDSSYFQTAESANTNKLLSTFPVIGVLQAIKVIKDRSDNRDKPGRILFIARSLIGGVGLVILLVPIDFVASITTQVYNHIQRKNEAHAAAIMQDYEDYSRRSNQSLNAGVTVNDDGIVTSEDELPIDVEGMNRAYAQFENLVS